MLTLNLFVLPKALRNNFESQKVIFNQAPLKKSFTRLSNHIKIVYFSRSMLTTRSTTNGVNLIIIRATKHVSLGGPTVSTITSNKITINNSLGLYNKTFSTFCQKTLLCKKQPYIIINKRFTGSRKVVEQTARTASNTVNHIPPTATNLQQGTPSSVVMSNTNNDAIKPATDVTSITNNTSNINAPINNQMPGENNFNSLQDKVVNSGMTPAYSNIKFQFFHDTSTQNFADNTSLAVESKENVMPKDNLNTSLGVPQAITNPYKGFYIDKPFTIITGEGQVLPKKQDTDHVFVATTGRNNSVAINAMTTSAKGGTPQGNLTNVKIHHTKYDGSFTPRTSEQKSGMTDNNDPIPNQKLKTVVDDYGNTIPHPAKGGQYIRIYPTPVIVSMEEQQKLGFVENTQATDYLNSYPIKETLDEISQIMHMDKDPSIMLSQESIEQLNALSTGEPLKSNQSADIANESSNVD